MEDLELYIEVLWEEKANKVSPHSIDLKGVFFIHINMHKHYNILKAIVSKTIPIPIWDIM